MCLDVYMVHFASPYQNENPPFHFGIPLLPLTPRLLPPTHSPLAI